REPRLPRCPVRAGVRRRGGAAMTRPPPDKPAGPESLATPLLLSRLRPRHVMAPLLLYTGACVTGPHPPSATFLSRAEEAPGGQWVLLPPYATSYAAWQLPPQSPWAAYNKATLLASLGDAPMVGELPNVRQLSLVQRAELAAMQLATLGLPADTLIV